MLICLVRAAAWDHIDVQGQYRAGPTPHWLWHWREMVLPFTGCSILENALPSHTSPLDCTVMLAGGRDRDGVWKRVRM